MSSSVSFRSPLSVACSDHLIFLEAGETIAQEINEHDNIKVIAQNLDSMALFLREQPVH